MKLNERSINNLKGVHPALINLAYKAEELVSDELPNYHFVITCGLRTIEEQKKLVAEKKSRTMNSKHLTGHAIDIAVFIDGNLTWEFLEYKKITSIFKEAAKELNIEIECGVDWKWKDSPHIQIDPSKYRI